MEILSSILLKTEGFKTVLKGVTKGLLPIEANGLSDIHKTVLTAALLRETKRKIVLLVPDEAAATLMCDDLGALGVKAALLPARDYVNVGFAGHSKEYEHKRIDTLSKLLDGAFDLLCLSAEAATQYTMAPEVLKKNT